MVGNTDAPLIFIPQPDLNKKVRQYSRRGNWGWSRWKYQYLFQIFLFFLQPFCLTIYRQMYGFYLDCDTKLFATTHSPAKGILGKNRQTDNRLWRAADRPPKWPLQKPSLTFLDSNSTLLHKQRRVLLIDLKKLAWDECWKGISRLYH